MGLSGELHIPSVGASHGLDDGPAAHCCHHPWRLLPEVEQEPEHEADGHEVDVHPEREVVQPASLGITGLIRTRFCFVITPVNKFLGLCNFCLFLVGSVQVGRILQYEYGQDMQLRSRAMGERISHHGKFSSMSEFQLKEQIMDKINYVERDKLEQVLQILDEDDEDDMEDLYE